MGCPILMDAAEGPCRNPAGALFMPLNGSPSYPYLRSPNKFAKYGPSNKQER